MKVILKPQAEKYLKKVPADIREKLHKCLDDISVLKGDIKPLGGGEFRYKIYHYRLIFTVDKQADEITVTTIDTRGNIKY